jgi:phosphate starvation-inducible PhoH-like protein
MVVTGDPSQDDLPPGTDSGLVDAVRRLDRTSEVAVVRFTAQDIVRHPLVETILKAYGGEAPPQSQPDVDQG